MPSEQREILDLSDPKWIDHPETLVERLLNAQGNGIGLDCGQLDGAPTVLVQILLAARRSARPDFPAPTLLEPTPAFLDGLDLLGLRAELLGGDC